MEARVRHTPPAGFCTHHSVRRTVFKGFQEISQRGPSQLAPGKRSVKGGDGFYPSRTRGVRRITQETCEGLQFCRRIALARTGFDLSGGQANVCDVEPVWQQRNN